ncbi:MAG: CehA/McbA family metallohydrolase [Planctomycetota bacterium]
MRIPRTVSVASTLFAIALAEPPAPGPGPVLLDAGQHHLGDNAADSFSPKKPLGPEWSAEIPKLPALPAGLFWGLVADVRHVVDANNREYEEGAYVDEVRINGVAVARLNDYAGPEGSTTHAAWVPLAGAKLEEGARISVAAGKDVNSANLDDFEIGNIRLAPMRRIEVRTGGPAKILVKGASRLGPDWLARAAGRGAFTADGTAELLLPADGTFTITASRGPEFEVATAEVGPWACDPRTLEPKRAFDTPGMISADFHVHSDPSPDSRIPLPDRVTGYLAEGVEWIVSTDHNRATDFGPAIRALGAEKVIRSSIGDEITSQKPRIGHFNVFPLTEAVDVTDMPVGALLARADSRAPRERRVLQVNHGRDGGIGYFEIMKFDPATLKSPEAGFELGFDAMEILNGKSDPRAVGLLLRDWYALLNAGYRLTATGNSDSHKLAAEDGGWPRNYVITGKDGFPPEAELVAAVRAHRLVISCGPVLDVEDAKGVSVVGSQLRGPVELTLRLRTPAWAPVKRLLLIERGTTVKTLEPLAQQKVNLSPDRDSWFVVIAEGERFEADVVTHGRLKPWGMTNPVWVTAK